MSEEIVKHEPTIMEIIQQMVSSPNARDQVEVMKELLAVKERMEAAEAKRAFDQALHDLQAGMPTITKDGVIAVKGTVRSRYATMDQLDNVLRPLMAEFGFSFQMTQVGIQDNMRQFAGTLAHVQGHEKTLNVFLPLDKSDFRTTVQSEGSTVSYARRQLYKLHFNIIERGPEEDGSGQNVQFIDAEQLRDLEVALKDIKANTTAFCDYFEIKKLAELKKADLARAMEMISRRKNSQVTRDENPSM